MMPAGVAAAQARISSIESRFAPIERHRAPDQRFDQRAPVADFETLLATARAGASTGVRPHEPLAPAPEVTPSHEMGAAGAPPELSSYGNGRIPAAALSPIGQGSHRLWAPAASSFQRMAEAAARDGIDIRVSDSYRSYDEQVALADRKGLYAEGGLAARPGTSNHGWGRSLDIDTTGGTVEWLRANAARFGFHEDVPREPWHWTYRPG